MDSSAFYHWLGAVTLVSVVIGFFLSLGNVGSKLGSTYRGAIVDAWLRILGALMLVLIYSGVSVYQGGWGKIFQSGELSAAALVILFSACQELCLGLSIKHNCVIAPRRLGILGGWALGWLVATVVSVVIIYQSAPVPGWGVLWQIVLLLVAVVTYFGAAVPLRLLRAGYKPKWCPV